MSIVYVNCRFKSDDPNIRYVFCKTVHMSDRYESKRNSLDNFECMITISNYPLSTFTREIFAQIRYTTYYAFHKKYHENIKEKHGISFS